MSDQGISITPTATADYGYDATYFNWSMVNKALFMEKDVLAAKYIAIHVKEVKESKRKLDKKDPIIARLNKADVPPKLLSEMIIDIVNKEEDGIKLAGDILMALDKLSYCKVRSALDEIKKTDKASAEKLTNYMKEMGYKSWIIF